MREVPINGGPRRVTMLVQAAKGSKSVVQSAQVASDDGTKMPEKHLKTGMLVDVVFSGPVTKSIPAQAHAAEVRIVQEEEYDILGKVLSINGNTILVEQSSGSDSAVDRASIRITSDTVMPATALKVGSWVAVKFTGPVAESYPVQARAGKIVLLGDAP
jgi:hypothetical protein